MVRRIAHISDVHILDGATRPKGSRYRFATGFVSIGRPLDAEARVRKLAAAMRAAHVAGADHVVVSGDLTEVGSDAEFEVFARALDGAPFSADQITLVPGNHDAYTSRDGWARALAGPLRAYRESSASAPGHVVDRGNVALLPVDSTRFQSIARSGGVISHDTSEALRARLEDDGLAKKPVVIVQHHPPFSTGRTPVWEWIDGLREGWRVTELLRRHPRAQLLHGHLHKVVDKIVGLARSTVFGAPATVDDRDGEPRVRLYDVTPAGLESVGLYAR